MPRTEFVLGDAFFTSFVGIFDVKKEELGLALSSRAQPGNSMTCTHSCSIIPWTTLFEAFVIILFGVGLTSLIIICLRRKDQSRQRIVQKEEERLIERKAQGLRGYDIEEEREEDDDDSD